MAAAAVATQEVAPKPVAVEEYGRSLVAFRHVGHLLVEAQVTVEAVREETELYHEYKTAVKEMLKNDPEHRGSLELANRREHDIINGQAVNASGEPMVDVLDNGVTASKLLAEEDPGYEHQVVRDECDVALANRVDAMPSGTTIWGVTKDPRKALETRPDIYHRRFGYEKGLIYFQTYSKTHNETVITGSYSVEYKDVGLLRELLAEHGMEIPADETDDTWLNHAQLTDMAPDEAHEFAIKLRRELARREGGKPSISVDEFVDQHELVLQEIFDTYYPVVAEAVVTRQNHQVLIDLASELLQGQSEHLKPEIRQQLLVLNNSKTFNDELAKTLDSILRYATVEELRKYLPVINNAIGTTNLHQGLTRPVEPGYQANIGSQLAQNVYEGVEAGRSYSGCPGNIELGKQKQEASESILDRLNRQEAYGGQAESDEDCEFVSKSCPKCGAKNVKTVVKKISETKKHIKGSCGCSKVYDKNE